MSVKTLSLAVVSLTLLTFGCDRLTAMKDQLLGSSESSDGGNPELEEIESLYRSRQCDRALEKIDALVREQPDVAEAFYYRGLCHLASAGEPEDPRGPLSEAEERSLEALERALAVNPRHAPSYIAIGDLYTRRVPARRRRASGEEPGDPYVLAHDAYEKAVSIDPELPEGQHHYARFLERTGQLEAAEEAYRAAADAAATVPEIAPDYYLAYGRFLAGPADRLEEALEQFELAQMFRQDDPAIQEQLAIVHSRMGRRHFEKQEYLLAEEALNRAYALFPDKTVPEAQQTSETLKELGTIRRR